MAFDDLVGTECLFYGVDNNMFKIDDKIWEAIEDADDGYRSMLGVVEEVADSGIFFRNPIALVGIKCIDDDFHTGYALIDIEDDHTWLVFGTDNTDDYYPSFFFNYTPKPRSKSLKPKVKAEDTKRSMRDPMDHFFEPRDA